MNKNIPKNSNVQIGMAVGLLVACAMTLLSVVFGLEPEVVLFRAFLGGGGATVLFIGMSSMVSLVFEDEDEF
ncbi:hypothetical protein [Thalassoglobus polymorphus]|uniref:Uncharacterized protein n=1 Tax=Thalassoglobus polymorphus TaxID=2527994 RepID=A0A517QPM0_9PLAN|nr:hypothetical protein [Thalassoglobus polymorphus]QDT33573.1 hypothetical protein Mal48_28260 [Thalassoglobus polymorphus]